MTTALVPLAQRPLPQRPPESDLLAAFLRGYHGTTLSTYRGKLAQFAAWMGVAPAQLPAAWLSHGPGVATDYLLAWQASLRAAARAPSTINVSVSAALSLARLARRLGHIDYILEIDMEAATAYRDTRGPGVAAVRAMREAAADASVPLAAARDAAVLSVAFTLALRRAEIGSLRLRDLELAPDGPPLGAWVLGKGKRERVRMTFGSQAAAELACWLEARAVRWPELSDDPDAPVFVTLPRPGHAGGRPLTGREVGRLVGRLGRRAGVGHVRAHGIRHTALTAALDAGKTTREVQALSRHARADTLATYDDNRLNLAGGVSGTLDGLL